MAGSVKEAQKYTLGEAAMVGSLVALGMLAIMVVMAPIALLTAYPRMIIWNWFVAPYFHLSPVSVWVMWIFGVFIGTFARWDTANKSDSKAIGFARIVGPIAFNYLALAIAALVHHFL